MTNPVPTENWQGAAAETLATLGFTLLNSDRPGAPGGSQLLVALRDRPTLQHFDPELVTCWVAAEGRGQAQTIDRRIPAGERQIQWGHLHVRDRLGVENRFLTFGGLMRVADVTPGFRVVQHVSPGPVVRWGGHSQGSDPLAGEIGAFFGRLIVPVDYTPGGEALIAAAPPAHLYAAFLVDRSEAARGAATARPRSDDRDPLTAWLRAEASRLRAHDPDVWSAGEGLLRELDLSR
jgi:hypothetical protein